MDRPQFRTGNGGLTKVSRARNESVDSDSLVERLLEAATSSGAESADALVTSGRSLSVDVRNGAFEHAEGAEGIQLGLRALIGLRQAVISGSDPSPAAIAEMAERAVAMAREAPEDACCGLADATQLADVRDGSALELESPETPPDPGFLKTQALDMEAAALEVGGVSRVDWASTGWSRVESVMAATNGFRGRQSRTRFSHSCSAISGSGLEMERDGRFESRTHREDLPDAREVGTTAGERAAARQGAAKPPTGAFPVLFDERVAGSLIGHLLSAINGTMIVRGASWLKDGMGTAILPAGCSLVAEPHRKRISGSRLFDAEGLATRTRMIVDDGILKSWILDLGTARKLGSVSTANAVRGVGGPPSPAAGNVTLDVLTRPRRQLLEDMGTGLLVTSMMGTSINPTTGDYSRGAAGFWVENGTVTEPVHECTIAGNLREMLLSIVAADDARPHRSVQVPSLLVEGLTIAGS